MGGKRGRVFRNNYKGHIDKNNGGGIKGGRWKWLVCVGEWGGVNEDNCTLTKIK